MVRERLTIGRPVYFGVPRFASTCLQCSEFFFSSSACVYPQAMQDHPEVTPLKEEDAMPADPDDIPKMKARGVDRLVVPVTALAGMPTLIDSPETALHFGDIIAKYADL